MKIGGLQKVSLIDFPGRIAAIVFTKGCNLLCPFCHNRDLVLGSLPTIPQSQVLRFLEKRKKILDGVEITGGEPLLQPDLADFIKKVKKLGYKIKLDTNGTFPEALKKLLQAKLIDYVALDFKAPLDGWYDKAVGKKDFDLKAWKASLELLLNSKIAFELRTTIVPGIHNKEILVEMAKQLKELKSCRGKEVKSIEWFWQNFQPKNCLDPTFDEKKPYKREQLEEFLKLLKSHSFFGKIR